MSIADTCSATTAAPVRPPGALQAVSDKCLIERIAEGDKLAMQVLWERHHARVFRFARRIVGDATLAEDLTSDTFLDVWRQAGRFEGRCAVSTWLLAIARHKALTASRRRDVEELDLEHHAVADPANNPEVALDSKDTGSILRRCVAGLSEKHAQIIELIYYQDKSVVEVAEIMGIPKNTVKTRAFHARSRLAEQLQQAGIDRQSLAALMRAA
jgi:RNA polymerase sigma-70 factor (ECF subfamily)